MGTVSTSGICWNVKLQNGILGMEVLKLVGKLGITASRTRKRTEGGSRQWSQDAQLKIPGLHRILIEPRRLRGIEI